MLDQELIDRAEALRSLATADLGPLDEIDDILRMAPESDEVAAKLRRGVRLLRALSEQRSEFILKARAAAYEGNSEQVQHYTDHVMENVSLAQMLRVKLMTIIINEENK